MRLRSIRLHPFGHFADQAWDLAKPLVVIHGPNEKGKTTLRQAIFHVLFTPTKLTKTQFDETVRPWLPLPDGDHAHVTLTFDRGGTAWTVEKRWGADQASRLSDGTTTLVDPSAVQARLGEMLEHGEATFRHVLFTGQAELEQTLLAIRKTAKGLRDIRDVLNTVAGVAADVDEQKLRRLLDARITAAFSRWDDATGGPERQGGQEKVGDNRWRREVGGILAAWYEWQDLEAERREVLAIEADMDRVAAEGARIEGVIRDRDAFVAKYGGLRAALGERGQLEERVQRLQQQVAALLAAFSGWPVAQAGIEAWNRIKPDLEAQLGDLKKELATARARQAGAGTIAAFGRIERAQKAYDDAHAEAAKHRHPGDDVLGEIQRLEQAVIDAENKLAARTLSWSIEAEASHTAMLRQGTDPPETVAIDPAGCRGTAQGRVQVTVDDIVLTVTSGADDVDAIFRALADDRERLAKQLEACGAESPAAARLMAERHRDRKTSETNARQVYEGLLQERTLEQWREAVQAITALAATREIETIERESDAKQKLLSSGEADAGKHEQALVGWKKLYADHAEVGRRLLGDQAELAKAKDRLLAVPSLPEGFATAEAFIERLDSAQAEQNTARDSLTARKTDLERLIVQHADRRSEDLAERAAVKRRSFERARAHGRAFLRIRQELDRIAAGTGDDSLAAFSIKVADTFSRITGRKATIGFDGALPASVERGGVSLSPDRLSHGGSGALALALRLAMAEAYFGGDTGFIMLDDPLVNLDPVRMVAATDVLREFASRSQVIFFTCHDHHAAQLAGTDGVGQPRPA
jgi:exonuclease SbcC